MASAIRASVSVAAPRATVRANAKATVAAKPAAPVALKNGSVIAARSAFKGISLTAARKAAAPAVRTTTVCRFVSNYCRNDYIRDPPVRICTNFTAVRV